MRQHLEHLAAALALLAFALFVSYFGTGTLGRTPPTHASQAKLSPVASSTPSFALSTSTLESLFNPLATSATSAPAHPTTPPATPAKSSPSSASSTPMAKPSPAPAPVASSTPPDSDAALLAELRPSIVNILCLSHMASLRSISGSGVIIDSRGIVLTVAHVAQMLLLEQYLGSDKVSCTLRTGSPARAAYLAHPIYVSEVWLTDNPTTLISSQPTGTGEHDYALLAITSSASGASLPGAFPAVGLARETPPMHEEVGVGSYGAQGLSGTEVKNALYPTFATSTVEDRFTFERTTVDVLALSGNAAAQEGSSGGAVVNLQGELAGVITTSDVTGDVASREMRAITPSYIERSFTDDTGKDFLSYFGDTSVQTLVNSYTPTAEAQGNALARAIGL